MSLENINKVNTKLKAYKLIHDPTVLLSLIYSKYGDIDEDLELLYINQLVYDKSSRYNIYFKEFNFYFNQDEFLKRFYKKYESKPRIPKLSEYYKNYHAFFCHPRFKDLVFSDLIQSYEDDKAELFYKKNFEDSNSKDDNEKDKSERNNTESLSSLDNITDNKIIFTKKTKKMIDKNLDSNCGTITLTTTSINLNANNNEKNKDNDNINKINNNDGLISSRDVNDSFEKIVHNLIYYKKSKKKVDKNKNTNNNINKVKKKEKSKKKEEKGYMHNKNNKNVSNNNIIKRKTIPNMNKNKIANKISFFTLLKKTTTIINTKPNKNNIINKNSLNPFFSPKIMKDNIYLSTKLEEFKNNLIKQNHSSHHQRNKTFNFNQNQTVGINHNNYTNNFNNISNLKSLNLRQISQLNNFLTMNNNLVKSQKVHHSKNKTFDNSPNFNNNIIKKIPTKIFQKNITTKKNMNNNDNINNQIIIKRNNIIKSKFNLMKGPLNNKNIKNKINLNKNIKNNNFKYYNTKMSPSNIFYRNLINNKLNINNHKKSQTTYLSPNFEIPNTKNKPSSPKIAKNQQKKYYNINKSDNISSKIKSKISKGRINNLNINFNNVIFNAPLSNINENINFNNNLINNNNSNSFKIVTNGNSNNFRNNNAYLNNNNSLNNSGNTNNNNLSDGVNQKDKNIYIMNLKNVYNNMSRNRMNIYGNSFTQTENYSLTSNNTKTNYDKNKNSVINHTYNNLYPNEKHNLFNIKKNKILIKKSSNKSGNQKNSKKIIKNSIKKTKKNIKNSNKKIDYGDNSNRLVKNVKNKRIDIQEKNNPSFQKKEKDNNSKILYVSPNTTGRNIISQHINVNRNSTLFSKKNNKSKKKIK